MSDFISPIWHPMTQHALMSDEIHIDRAEGAYLYRKDGSAILDAISSWWVITHGHCHPKIVAAVQKQAAKLEQVIFAGFTHDPAEELTEKLMAITAPEHEFVFYSDSGSTAVEVALKMAIGYHAHTASPRHKVIALEGGYHGDTFGTMSAGSRGVFNKLYEPFLFETVHVPVPIFGAEEAALSALEEILARDGDDIAAFIFEPLVQGAAGMVMYSAESLKAMAAMCQARGVLLIADEVMTGFGRTGAMFACEKAGIVPDLVALSKGITGGFLPMGVTLCTRDIYMAFYQKDRTKTFFHSTSFTGNALACAAAKASLEIWEGEDVMARISAIDVAHGKAVSRFEAREDVDAVRHQGTLLALDVRVEGTQGYLSALGPKLYEAVLAQDILLRPIGNTIYVLPPYCITPDELECVYSCIESVIECVG